jgi:hypothetical protein
MSDQSDEEMDMDYHPEDRDEDVCPHGLGYDEECEECDEED